MARAKKRGASFIDDSEDVKVEDSPKATKKTKTAASAVGTSGQDDDGNPYWDLSNKRRVAISEFKNMWFVNIREYYEKDGKLLPGKKGISLSVEQFQTILRVAPAINAALKSRGQATEDDVEVLSPIQTKDKKSKADKANIEATSDEDEEE